LFPEQIVYVANEAEDQVVLVDLSVAKLLAPVLADLDTVHTVIAVGEGDTAPLEESGKTVLRYAEMIGGQPTEFDWPDIDENSAAAMCYTSGTTGNPKGVVYSHRSTYLHTMAACTGNGIGIGSSDCVLPIVPMFHANAWGLPYAALMAGADLVLPDRHLDAPSLIQPEGSEPVSGSPEQIARRLYAHPERVPPIPAVELAMAARRLTLVRRLSGPARDRLLEDGLRRLKVPTLAMFGTQDTVIPAEMGRIYKELIPNAHLVPAGIVAVNRAQEHGYTFAYAA